MANVESVEATSGDRTETFHLAWPQNRWSSDAAIDEAAFPFVAHVSGRRFELYSDGTFDEEELDSTGPAG